MAQARRQPATTSLTATRIAVQGKAAAATQTRSLPAAALRGDDALAGLRANTASCTSIAIQPLHHTTNQRS
jgi:hypothetical protein